MATIAEHYRDHLGPLYEWTLGGDEHARQAAERDVADLRPAPGAVAVDLGAGPGFHAVALADLGYQVVAIDTDPGLLDRLEERTAGKAVTAVCDDLVGFPDRLDAAVDLVICMGDTLTHLPDHDALATLVTEVASSLAPGGTFVATFRDYTTPLEGDDRFLQVRADDDRIHTLFLEYHPDVVVVHDIINDRTEQGWTQTVSSYPKLRIRPPALVERLRAAGLEPELGDAPGGMRRITASRP